MRGMTSSIRSASGPASGKCSPSMPQVWFNSISTVIRSVAARSEVKRLALAGKTIEAIKVLRDHTGMPLKDAKDAKEAVEAVQRGGTPITVFDALDRSSSQNRCA